MFILINPLPIFGIDKNINENNSSFKVEWIREYNNNVISNKEKGIGRILYDFIFGEDVTLFNRPFNLRLINSNSIWILDQGNKTILNFDLEKKTLNNPTEKIFPSLVGICSDQNDNIYFSDSKKNTIFIKKAKSNQVEVFNVGSKLLQPTGLAYFASENQIWVCETGNHRLVQLNENGEIINTIGRRGTEKREFNFPTFLWIDFDGLVYIVDSMNFRIQILDSSGNVHFVFGEPGNATGFLARPKGIATDSKGHIYVVDGLYHTVQIFDKNGNFLFNFGYQGSAKGEFWLPVGIYIDDKDFIYVADSYNSRIQVFRLFEKVKHEK
jgi:DNA-binding beta-propeller fold protein YncE